MRKEPGTAFQSGFLKLPAKLLSCRRKRSCVTVVHYLGMSSLARANKHADFTFGGLAAAAQFILIATRFPSPLLALSTSIMLATCSMSRWIRTASPKCSLLSPPHKLTITRTRIRWSYSGSCNVVFQIGRFDASLAMSEWAFWWVSISCQQLIYTCLRYRYFEEHPYHYWHSDLILSGGTLWSLPFESLLTQHRGPRNLKICLEYGSFAQICKWSITAALTDTNQVFCFIESGSKWTDVVPTTGTVTAHFT